MNMPIRPDEEALWNSFGPGCTYPRPRYAAAALQMPTNRLVYLCNKWSSKGLYDWGTTVDMGWKTDEASLALRGAMTKAQRDRVDALEDLCWQAIRSEDPVGIVIIEGPIEYESDVAANRFAVVQEVKMGLDPRVPSMQVYLFQGMEAYDSWVERGCPTR